MSVSSRVPAVLHGPGPTAFLPRSYRDVEENVAIPGVQELTVFVVETDTQTVRT